MNHKKYKLIITDNKLTQEWLDENDFYWNNKYKMYIHHWTLCKIGDFDVVYGELRLDPNTLICEFDAKTGKKSYYGPYLLYLRGFADLTNPYLTGVLRHIKSEFHRLGIVEVLP